MKNFKLLVICIQILLTSCGPSIQDQPVLTRQICTPASVPFTKTSTATIAPIPTGTPIRRSATTPTPTPTFTHVPVDNLAFLYELDGNIYRYNMMTWYPEKIDIPITGDWPYAVLSPSGKYLAYFDDSGFKQYDRESGSVRKIYSATTRWPSHATYTDDEKLLAYNDAEGLKIYNLESGTVLSVIRHELDPVTIDGDHYYYPANWSPDNNWLVIGLAYYEGCPDLSLYNLSTQEIYALTDCCSDVIWANDSTALYYNVSYSGYSGCGENPGIFQATFDGKDIIEQVLYASTCSLETSDCWVNSLGLDHSGEIFSFIEQNGDGDAITLLFPDGSILTETSPTGIWGNSLIWSDTSGEVIYANQEGAYRMAIDTFEKTMLAPLPSGSESILLSPDARWLMVERSHQTTPMVHLIDLNNGFMIDIICDHFIGWDTWK